MNRDAPAGFQVTRHIAGGEQNRFNQYHVASAYGTSIYRGALVIPGASGKEITVAAAVTNRVIGVFDGVQYTAPDGEPFFRPYWPASTVLKTGTLADANVYDDPKSLFEVQADEDIEAADIGALANPVEVGGGVDRTGQSTQELDSSSIGAGAVLKILELSKKVDNAYGVNAKVIVALALHYLGGAMTAI
jgi:hypothetical protein